MSSYKTPFKRYLVMQEAGHPPSFETLATFALSNVSYNSITPATSYQGFRIRNFCFGRHWGGSTSNAMLLSACSCSGTSRTQHLVGASFRAAIAARDTKRRRRRMPAVQTTADGRVNVPSGSILLYHCYLYYTDVHIEFETNTERVSKWMIIR
jgi:hypothetical protein